MSDLAATSLSPDERVLLEWFASLLRARLGEDLHAVWLFGSRARGEALAHEDSDVDLLVLVEDDSWDGSSDIYRVLDEAAPSKDPLGNLEPVPARVCSYGSVRGWTPVGGTHDPTQA
ncbi:MAG TPA: nucleotidyltransferase domain-containing protein [Solirubrobacteraceae bacterium]|nr:nucleotidyltransferase domain-containing protein [Solirubrobacteraceae bacterium]